MPDTPSNLNALFTLSSLLSLQGATAASLLIPNVLTYLIGLQFKPYEKWTAFAIALLLALVTAFLATDANNLKWLVAIFNGFLIFASAVGLNEMAARTRQTPGTFSATSTRASFFHSWLP
ncbi:MAG: hypothetical protein B6D41_03760 [Chloroflexi bacterium UTCFX4]|jgi:hypothetical protein|nr:MAG: hypothetical protein B6D41_03760 [Chloroflexi bacterium UTCFX4]